MRVALLNPLLVQRPRLRWTGEHLGLESLAAALRQEGHEVSLLDADLVDMRQSDVLRSLESKMPALLGISVCQEGLHESVSLARAAKAALDDVRICVGGHLPSAKPQAFLSTGHVDFVCTGEGDLSLPALASALEMRQGLSEVPGLVWLGPDGARQNARQQVVVGDLPWPARDLTGAAVERGAAVFMSSSRGCYGRCSFCSIRAFYGGSGGRWWRARTPIDTVSEMADLVGRFPGTPIVLVDDNFIGPPGIGPARATAIADLIAAECIKVSFSISCRVTDVEPGLFEPMARAGLRKVFLGFESFEDDVLRELCKGTSVAANLRALDVLRSTGVDINPSLILFTPWSTLAGVRRAFDVLECRTPGYDPAVLFSRLWPLENTSVGGELSPSGLAASDIRDAACRGFYAPMVPVWDDILRLNEALGRRRGQTGAPYGAFARELASTFSGILEDVEANGPRANVVARGLDAWSTFARKWQEVCQSPSAGTLPIALECTTARGDEE